MVNVFAAAAVVVVSAAAVVVVVSAAAVVSVAAAVVVAEVALQPTSGRLNSIAIANTIAAIIIHFLFILTPFSLLLLLFLFNVNYYENLPPHFLSLNIYDLYFFARFSDNQIWS
jgi:hypothetical protein